MRTLSALPLIFSRRSPSRTRRPQAVPRLSPLRCPHCKYVTMPRRRDDAAHWDAGLCASCGRSVPGDCSSRLAKSTDRKAQNQPSLRDAVVFGFILGTCFVGLIFFIIVLPTF